jgi:hypothetical protein
MKQCAATMFTQAGAKTDRKQAGGPCPETAVVGRDLCWLHQATFDAGLASQQDILTGKRERAKRSA